MDALHLDERIIAVKPLLEKGLGDRFQKSILFGSHARGEQNESSDIDILVILNGTMETLEGFRPFFREMEEQFFLSENMVLQIIPVLSSYFDPEKNLFFRTIAREGIEL